MMLRKVFGKVKMKQILYPVCCANMIFQSDEKLVFRTFSGRRCTFKSNLELILALLQKSTGIFMVDEIVCAVSEEMDISTTVVSDVVDDLVICEILMDSHEQFLKYHALTCNPPRYPSDLSFSEIDELTQKRKDYTAKDPITVYGDTDKLSLSVFDILKKRHSCRDFLEIPVEVGKLFAMCKVSYSSQLRPIASAGALFPLSIYFVNRICSGQLPAGLYQYDHWKEKLLLLNTEIFPEMMQYALNDMDCIFGAPCIFFVCADIGRHMKKYANAGYRYTLLEAGHAVQNMTIAAGEIGLGGVEYGGFCDEAVKQMFRMPEEIFPLACYAVGYENTERIRTENILQSEQEKRIIEKIVRDKMSAVHSFLVEDERLKHSNVRVMVSSFEDVLEQIEFGTGVSPGYGTAYMKSVMEAYERYVLSSRYFDRLERADRLGEKYLNPSEYAPYSDAQRKENGFAEFREDDPVEWLQGYDLDGCLVYVPADLCFYTSDRNGILYHTANSSGCAANFNMDAARRAALLELIERDAIVKNWFYRQTPDKLNERDMPDHIRYRLRQYQKLGISVFILTLPCEYAYTVLVCSVNYSTSPYFTAGAGASFLSVEEAVVKAFDEWEVSFVLGETSENSDIMMPEAVVSPKDHGSLYRCTNYNKEIEYLLQGQQIDISEVSAGQLGNIRTLAPVFVNYRPFVDGAYVVRAFSKELIPINFGYGMDFHNHFKVNKQLLKDDRFPHFFS